MSNHIIPVRDIIREKQLGWPNGTGDLHKKIEYLLKRIDELELAIVPFGRAYIIEQKGPSGQNFLPIRSEDCQAAHDVMDPTKSVQKLRETFFDAPAE